MKLNVTILMVMLAITFPVFGQNLSDKADFRIGTGLSLLGHGDMLTFNYENELNLKINQYLSNSFSFDLGRSNKGVFKTASFIEGNYNFFISPLKNNKRFDLRIGTGLALYSVSDCYEQYANFENGEFIGWLYYFENRTSFGYNVIIENTYLIIDRFMIGLKLFTQPFFNGDINSGVLLKCGLKLK